MSTKPAKKPADTPATTATASDAEPVPAEKSAKTALVTFLRSHPNFAYWPGDKADIDADKAKELIEGGFAE